MEFFRLAKSWRGIIKQRGASPLFMMALDIQKMNSGIYFAAAALLICLAAMLAGRKVQRNLKGKWIASVIAVSVVTLGLIWLLLSALNRREAEPRTSPPDYPAPSATP
jgi:hypothetical protein